MTTVWLEKHHVGARGEECALMFVDRCCIAGRALWFYAGKLVWPYPLTFIYPPLARRSIGLVAGALPGCGGRRGGGAMVPPRAHQQGAARGDALLREHALSCARLLRCLPDALLVRRESLPVPGEPRADRVGRSPKEGSPYI